MEFDPDYGLCIARTDLVTRHSARMSIDYARRLLASGDPEKTALAWRIVRRAFDSQVVEEGHPHRGAFRFFDEDEEVTGLNVVSFVLQFLHAIWFHHHEAIPEDLRALLLERVRLALEELERMDVHPRYTNPALMDAANCVLWGQILGDASTVASGATKLDRWIEFTAAAGAPYEYNSPNYLVIDLNMLALLAGHADDSAVRLTARLMEERIWLHALLHYHAPTNRLAGPHSRAYHRYMLGAEDGVLSLMRLALEGRPLSDARVPLRCPPHLVALMQLQTQSFPYTVREVAGPTPNGVGQAADIVTYCTATYALGTAGRTYTSGQTGFDIDHEANHCILYYRPDLPSSSSANTTIAAGPADATDPSGPTRLVGPTGPASPASAAGVGIAASSPSPQAVAGAERPWRMLYTRFVTNDRYYGTIEQHALRTKQTNFYDQGLFAGHQHKNVAIALYGLELQDQGLSSVEAMVVLPGSTRPAAVYAGTQPLPLPSGPQAPPVPLADGEWFVVEDGSIWAGVLPLTRDQMGNRRGLELRVLPTGELALAMPHYRGPEKWFWEYQSPHAAFYRRNIRSGCLLVVGERAEYPDLAAFHAHLKRAQVTDALESSGVRTVGYRNTDAWLEMEHDLVRNETIARRIDGQPFTAPALSSPWAVQTSGNNGGTLTVGQASLDAAGAPAYLVALDSVTAPSRTEPPLWEAVILAEGPHAVRLETPAGTLRCDAFGFGAIRVEAPPNSPPMVTVRTAAPHAPIQLPPGATLATLTHES